MKRQIILFGLVLAIVMAFSLNAQQRIVLAGRGANMLADAIYLFPDTGERLVAYSSGDQGLGLFMSAVDPAFKEKVCFDKSAGVEVIASFKPDLVILKSIAKSQYEAQLNALGIRQLYLTLETPEQYYEDIATLGKVLGNQVQAAEIVSWYADHEKKNSQPYIEVVCFSKTKGPPNAVSGFGRIGLAGSA